MRPSAAEGESAGLGYRPARLAGRRMARVLIDVIRLGHYFITEFKRKSLNLRMARTKQHNRGKKGKGKDKSSYVPKRHRKNKVILLRPYDASVTHNLPEE